MAHASSSGLKSGLVYESKGWATEITRLDTNYEPIGTQDHTAHFDYLHLCQQRQQNHNMFQPVKDQRCHHRNNSIRL